MAAQPMSNPPAIGDVVAWVWSAAYKVTRLRGIEEPEADAIAMGIARNIENTLQRFERGGCMPNDSLLGGTVVASDPFIEAATPNDHDYNIVLLVMPEGPFYRVGIADEQTGEWDRTPLTAYNIVEAVEYYRQFGNAI